MAIREPLGAPIHPLDIPFGKMPVVGHSSSGEPLTRWATYGMPKLGEYQFLMDIVFFLYPSEEDAMSGKNAGGTGFLVALASEAAPNHHAYVYAITNWHVAVSGGCSVIRLNRRDGGVEILAFEPHEWNFLPNGHDIAAIQVDLDPKILQVEAISAESFFLTEQQIVDQEINAADDVFMIGRFIDWDGGNTNRPAMRFGNISMMEANVPQPTKSSSPSIIVDMHSRTGFSGSPVFIYRTTGAIFSKPNTLAGGGHMMKLLGILWGVFPESWDIEDGGKPVVLDGKKQSVRGLSGMSLVCPAASIWEALQSPSLRKLRDAKEVEIRECFAGAPMPL